MDQKTLHILRLIVPGSFILVFAVIFFISIGILQVQDLALDDLSSGVLAIVIGVAYRFSGIRERVNRQYFDRVNENIRSSLVRISGHVDNIEKFSWKKIRRVFYDLVDNDESLKVLSRQVMFNGLFWTSAADLTAISSIFLGAGLFAVLSGYSSAIYASIFYFFCGLVGFVWSRLTTNRHLALGNEQLEQIEQKYAKAAQDKVRALA